MSESMPSRPSYVPAYTVCLFVVSVLAAMTLFSHQMMMEIFRQKNGNEILTAVFRFLQAVGVLRSRKSPLARPTTAAVSILLAVWFPFGTAIFIWWVAWVRRRERCPERG